MRGTTCAAPRMFQSTSCDGLVCGRLLRRRESDHLDTRPLGDVHRADDVAVLAVRCRLDEQQLRRALIAELVEPGIEGRDRDRLSVDRVRPGWAQLQPALIARP